MTGCAMEKKVFCACKTDSKDKKYNLVHSKVRPVAN